MASKSSPLPAGTVLTVETHCCECMARKSGEIVLRSPATQEEIDEKAKTCARHDFPECYHAAHELIALPFCIGNARPSYYGH